jgi:predicted methyltransferase
LDKFKKDPASYSKVGTVRMDAKTPLVLGPDGTADLVLTFRNLHNWTEGKIEEQVLDAAFKVLKSGGVLGVVDHRASPSADLAKSNADGYLPEAWVIERIEKAGFHLAEKSEINANPKDTKDYPKGVWTLPPSYELGDQDHAKYAAIGESDRMTLKFVKP